MKIKNYSIDGKYGRADFDILEVQNGKDTTHNFEELEQDGTRIDGKEFVEGLPEGITKDDYFRMTLLGAIRGLKNSTYKSGDNIKGNLKGIETQLESLNKNIEKLINKK